MHGAREARRRAQTTFGRTLGVAIVAGALLGAPAWGVAVSVTVTGEGDAPVAFAEIDLGLGGPTATTDEDGRATVQVADEQLGRETEATIIYTDPVTGEQRTQRRRVLVAPDIRLSVPTAQAPPRPPKRSKPLGRDLACTFAGGEFQVGIEVGTAEVDKTPLEEQSFEFVGLVDGVELLRTSGSKSGTELAEINRMEKKKHERDEVGPIFARIPLFRGSCQDGSRKVVPALRLGAGQADIDFTSTNVEMPGFSQSFSGDGWMYGGGLDLTFFREEKRCVYGLGIEYYESESIDVRRSVDLATTFFGPGTMTLRDNVTYDYETTSLRFTVGHAGERFLPYAGLRYTWFESTLRFDSAVDIGALTPSIPSTSLVVQEQRARSRFGDEFVEGIFGLVARAGGPAAVRGEVVLGEDGFEIRAGAVLNVPAF